MYSEAMARRIEVWPIEKLIPYARNPRTHSPAQVSQLAASIAEFGFVNPVLVASDAGIMAGHGRLLGAQELKLKEVPVIVLDHLTPSQRRAYLLADNKLAELAGWDEDLLRMELKDLQLEDFDLGVIGFSDEELAELLADDGVVTTGLTDEDAVPDVPERPVSVAGDLWVLGDHRVLCGDATDLKAVRKLIAGEQADLVFTDPPYNVDYEGYTADKLTIKGDKMKPAEFDKFLRGTFASYRAVVRQGASMYVCHASSVQREFQNALEASGFEVRCQIIWAKNTFAWGHGRYKFQHEPIFYCHRAKQSDAWYGDKTQSTLWQEKKPAANRLHPTMKPIELIERALLNSSKGGDCVLDLFGGSGSTLIACERRSRKARHRLTQCATGPWCLSVFLDVAAASGARRGEVLALRWSDLQGMIILIDRSLCQTNDGLVFKSTKTEEPRKVELPPSMVARLVAHRLRQDEFRRQFGPDYRSDLDLIFANPDGSPLMPNSISSTVSRLCRRLGLPKGASLHVLRHSHASLLLADGVDLATVSARLGHSSVRTTADIYSHAIRGKDHAAAQCWDDIMQRARDETEKSKTIN